MSAKTNEEPTPFQKAGYTKDTKFRVLKDAYLNLKSDDTVTLLWDTGDNKPLFKTDDGRKGYLYLPSMSSKVFDEELEVYGGDK